jgi:uncharacterized protein YgiM (DUF1202 family)
MIRAHGKNQKEESMLTSEARNEKNDTAKEPVVNEKPEFTLSGKVINCGRLRVREKASEDARVITEIPVGTLVKIHEIGSVDFVHVQTKNGVTGYCMTKFIEKLSPNKN